MWDRNAMPILPWPRVPRPSTPMCATTRNLPRIFEPHPKKTTNIKALSELMSIEPNEEEVSSHNPISEYPSKVEIFEILTMIESVLGKTNINNLMKEI